MEFPRVMRRKEFIKISSIAGISLAIFPHLSFKNFKEEFTRNQLIGKRNPDIVGESYTSKMHKTAKEAFLRMKAEAVKENQDVFELRRTALTFCLSKLRKKDRELIQRRYQGENQGKDLADDLGRPANSVYQSLGRVRRTLFECINRYIASESYSHE